LPADWQRELAALWRLEADVNNGAYLQFLSNWGRESYVYASQALKKIGARKMADLIDRCQALMDEHFGSEGQSPADLRQLLPNRVINSDGKLVKEAGSVLPDLVVARINELSYRFMNYPDNLAKLGMKFYRSYLHEIEQVVDDREKALRAKRESTVAALEADLRAAEGAQQEKLKQGRACPKCGFSYSWNGAECGHCHYVRT
jgi:hypothetical protein